MKFNKLFLFTIPFAAIVLFGGNALGGFAQVPGITGATDITDATGATDITGATGATGGTGDIVDNDGDGVPEGKDCDDNDPNNFPGNFEVKDGQDNDCDSEVDEVVTIPGELTTIWGSTDHPDHPEHATLHFLSGPDYNFQLKGLQEASKSQGGPFEFLRKDVLVTGMLFPSNVMEVREIVQEGPIIFGEFEVNSHILGSHVSGSQKFLTLPCKFGDVAFEPAFDFASYMDFMDDFWQEVSYNNINLAGSVETSTWYDMPDPKDDYFNATDNVIFFGKAASDCMVAADSDFNYTQFDGINLMYNSDLKGYSWGGFVKINIDGQLKTYPTTWMAEPHYTTTQNILGQEMGHAFGLPHESGPYDTPYDSYWDVMSTGGDASSPDPTWGKLGVHVVAPYKDALGWISGVDVYDADMSDDQEVFIERLAEPTNLADPDVYLEALIPIGGSLTDFYSIEARKFVGFDDSGVPGETILIHKVDTTLEDRVAQLVDDSDNDDPNDAGVMWDPGELFVDEANNISVAVVNMTDTGFNIIINPTVADLSIEKTGPSDPVVAGTDIIYTIEVENNGPNNAENVVVVDTLHPSLVYLNNTDSCVEAPANTLTCDLGNIPNGGSDSFDVAVEIPADYVYNGGSFVGNEVEVYSDQFDDNMDNNEDSVVNEVIAVTDIAILSFNATETPIEVLLGDSFNVTLSKNVTNYGISSPVDIDAMVVASGDGVSIVPSPVFPSVDAVEKDEVVELFEGEFMVTCEEYGAHEITFSNEIVPVNAEDPDLSNNEAEIVIEVDCLLPVQINIHPASDPNSINIIKRMGVITVAILSTEEGEYGLPVDVNATNIDPLSVHFGPSDVLFNVIPAGGATEFHGRGHIEDSYELDEITQDGDLDMVLHFMSKETELDETDTEGCVKGKIDIEGMNATFFGCDAIRITP